MINSRAAVLTGINSPLEIEEVLVPPPSLGQVRVRMIRSGVCGAQLQEIRGEKGNSRFVPHLLGHEGFGIVQDVGVGVNTVIPGDQVVLHWRKGEGIESEFPKYIFRGKHIASGKVVTFSEFVLASENRVTRCSGILSAETYALLGCALSTSIATLEKYLKLGQKLAIAGGGGLGSSLLVAAKLIRPSFLTVFEINEEKHPLLRNLGAEYCYTRVENTDMKFDLIIDTTGNKRVIEECFTRLGPSGKLILVGQPKSNESLELRNAIELFHGSGKMVLATQGGGFDPAEDIPRYEKALTGLEGEISAMITHRLSLMDINLAIELINSSHAGRVVIQLGDS